MGKIRLNLVSGAVIEKPLISAFKINDSSYVVLDNEMNGSMGLPIILVSKFDGLKLTKIENQTEWQNVKEYLKNIIAGNEVEYISLTNDVAADEIYYTQLTLPVPSFDILKNSYNVDKTQMAPVDNVMPNSLPNEVPNEVQNEISSEIPNEVPVVEEPKPVEPMPVIEPTVEATPVEPVSIEPVVPNVDPVVNEPILDNNIMANPMVDTPVEPAPQVNDIPAVDIGIPLTADNNVNSEQTVMPNELESSNLNNISVEPIVNDSTFSEQKEAFMKACENMFDALVQKFEKELESRK